jgi:hypothetical protein
MFQTLRTAYEIVYSTQDVWVGLPYVCITAGIFTGGSIGWYGIIWVLRWCLVYREYGSQWVLSSNKGGKFWEPRPSRTIGSIIHLSIQTLFFSGLVFIIWIACAAAGFNPWTTATASLSMSIIFTYVFATPLSLIGSGYDVLFMNAISIGEHVQFHGMGPGWDGTIIGIYSQYVELQRWDEDTMSGEIIKIPISQFLSQPSKRNWRREYEAKQTCKDAREFDPPNPACPPETQVQKIRFRKQQQNKMMSGQFDVYFKAIVLIIPFGYTHTM